MSKKENVVEKKPYGVADFFKNFIILQIILLYVTLMIGDAVAKTEDISSAITRYIPIALVGLVSSFLFIRSGAKKINKKEEENLKKKVLIAPIVVAVILLCYGLYSVHSNVSKVKKEMKGIYILAYGEVDEEFEEFEEEIKDAANEARGNWLITSVSYLVAVEVVAFLTSKKLGSLMKEEIQEQIVDGEILNDIQQEINNEPEEEKTQEPLNNIKWDL